VQKTTIPSPLDKNLLCISLSESRA